MEEKIVLILNEMSEYLSIAQMKKLQEVVLKTFSENEADKQEISNNDFLQMFLDAKRIEGCSERTIQYYRVTVEHLFSKMNQSVRRITTEEIRTYLSDYQKINRCSNVTIDNIRRNISSFFSWLEEEDYILKSPMKRIHKIKTKTVVKSVITDEGIEKLRDNCAEIRDLAIIDLLYSTGIRVGELVNLNIEDIDLEGRECIVYGKGDKERRVYFDAKAKVHLKEYIEKRKDNNEALFVTLDAPHDRLKISGVEIRLRQLGRQLKLDRIHPHKFRRTMATRAIDKGMPIEQVQKILGHAKIIFSTYQTMLHAIDTIKNADGSRFFSPGHFSLIVIDEAHRSIFNKYKAIFQYFDACLLGLTATPKNTIHQSTYTFFDMKNNIPTDVYEYEEAVEKDHVLVPFYLIETSTQISDDGITYADLDEEEREAYEAEFVEDGGVPEHIPPERINKYIFNVDTVDRMISDLMNNGIRHKNGNHVGKTIIFAQNKLHAKFIVDRFNELYPQYKGNFCKLVVCDEPYAGQNLKDFKKADDYPFITVTVDMLETGIDVPEITNLVFAKKVYSRIKFEQMLGRGTRLCENLFGEGEDKKEFVVFDYMRNFQFFDEHPKGREAGEVVAPVAARFIRMVQMIKCLQDANYVDVKYQNIRENLIDHVVDDVKAMGTERVEVRLELRYVERYKERKQYECLEEIHKEEIIDHLAKLVVSDEKDEAAISFDVLMYGLMLSVMTGGKNLGRLKRYVVGNANILLKECATIPDIKVRISELKELVSDHYWDVQDVLKFEETRKSLREIMKYIPAKKEKLHYSNFKDIVVFREEGRLTSLSASDFEDYRAKVNEYVEAHKTTPAINKLLHNEPISVEDYNELERIFTVELGTAEDYEMNYQDTPFGLLIRKIAKMDRTAAYAAFSTFILEERPNTEQLHFIEQVVDYVVENGYINNVLDLMKTPFDRPYKFSLIFTYEEQVKFVKIINNIKNNALVT